MCALCRLRSYPADLPIPELWSHLSRGEVHSMFCTMSRSSFSSSLLISILKKWKTFATQSLLSPYFHTSVNQNHSSYPGFVLARAPQIFFVTPVARFRLPDVATFLIVVFYWWKNPTKTYPVFIIVGFLSVSSPRNPSSPNSFFTRLTND